MQEEHVIQIENEIITNVDVSINSVVHAKSIIAGILAHVSVTLIVI